MQDFMKCLHLLLACGSFTSTSTSQVSTNDMLHEWDSVPLSGGRIFFGYKVARAGPECVDGFVIIYMHFPD